MRSNGSRDQLTHRPATRPLTPAKTANNVVSEVSQVSVVNQRGQSMKSAKTTTSASHVVEPLPYQAVQVVTHNIRTPHNNRRVTPTPRDVDTASDSARHIRHRRHCIRHTGDHATPLRPSTMATQPHTNAAASTRDAMRPYTNAAASLHRDGSRSSRDIRDATVQHLLYICCLLIKSAKNLISLLLKKSII